MTLFVKKRKQFSGTRGLAPLAQNRIGKSRHDQEHFFSCIFDVIHSAHSYETTLRADAQKVGTSRDLAPAGPKASFVKQQDEKAMSERKTYLLFSNTSWP